MKTQAMTSGLRVTLSATELRALLNLARFASDQLAGDTGYHLDTRQAAVAPEIIHGLELGLANVRWKQAEARSRRDAPKREDERRAAREYHGSVDGFTVIGTLSDWADASSDPDRRHWIDLSLPQNEAREQGEIRRNVWRLHVIRGRVGADDYIFLPSDCTESAHRAEIEPLARKIIAAHRTAEVQAA